MRQLYDRHGAALLLFARGFVADASAAEDLVHGVFLNLLRTRPNVREAPAAYLYRAVKNAALNQHRNRSREDPLPDHEAWFVHRGGDREAALALQSALAELPAEQREALVMRIWSGMTLEEVANATGVPLNTAASRYRYAPEEATLEVGIQQMAQAENPSAYYKEMMGHDAPPNFTAPAAKDIADARALFADAEAALHLPTAQARERMLAIQARVSTLHPYFRETTPTLTKVNDARAEVEASRQKLLQSLGGN